MSERLSVDDYKEREMSGGPSEPDLNPAQAGLSTAPSEITQEVRDKAQRFIEENATVLSSLMGVSGVTIEVGNGWSTNLESGKVTVDPSFFLEQGYKQDWVNYGLMHEVAAHLLGLIQNPVHAKEQLDWVEEDKSMAKSKHLFLNIMSDITGNKRIHSLLPRQKQVAEEVYSQKLFPEEDYSDIPRHFQFLYKMIRTEMLPGSVTFVGPDVEQALAELRNFSGKGIDIIKESTDRRERGTNKEIDDELRFRLWVDYIYPVYLKLLQQDIEDGNDSQQGEGQQGENNEPQSGEPNSPSESQQGGGSLDKFDNYYEDYEQNRHPEPIDHEELEKTIDDAINAQAENTPEARERKRLQQEIGNHSISEYKKFRSNLNGLVPQVSEMAEFFGSLLDERVVTARKLNTASAEGAILNPNTIAQTMADIKSGVAQPPQAFLEYSKAERERKAEGRFDCYLAVDCSGSMGSGEGSRSAEAQKATLVFLEGLAAFERQIRERERSGSVKLDWDARSCVYAFGTEVELLKPLGHDLSTKQRLDTFAGVGQEMGGTNDYLALEQIAETIELEIRKDPTTKNRRRMVFVITDGDSAAPAHLQAVIQRLTQLGVSVVGIGLQTTSIEDNYPIGKSIDDVKSLTKTLIQLVETEIAR